MAETAFNPEYGLFRVTEERLLFPNPEAWKYHDAWRLRAASTPFRSLQTGSWDRRRSSIGNSKCLYDKMLPVYTGVMQQTVQPVQQFQFQDSLRKRTCAAGHSSRHISAMNELPQENVETLLEFLGLVIGKAIFEGIVACQKSGTTWRST